MKKTLFRLGAALLLLALPALALADTAIESTTIFRFSQDDRPGYARKNFMPATQFLGVDADRLADGNLSLHLYGWGRIDLRDRSFNDDHSDGVLTYGYLQYRFKQANARIRAGRFFISEGIVHEQVDGLSARTDLPHGFGVSAFGGATVRSANLAGEGTDGKGSSIYGGRFSYRHRGMLEVGLSGVAESAAPALGKPVNQALAQAGYFGDRRLLGGDLWFSPHRMVELIGRNSYNTETHSVAEQNYVLHLKPRSEWAVTAEFNEYRERSLYYSSLLFASLARSLEEGSRSWGGRVSYTPKREMEFSADYRRYSRDIGLADRFGGDLRISLLDRTLRIGAGYHYLRSGPDYAVIPSLNASGSFHEIRAYAMRDTKTYFAAFDAVAYIFKKSINNRDSAWETIASIGYHLAPGLALSGDISYGQNPLQDHDIKGLLRLTFNTNILGKGGSK